MRKKRLKYPGGQEKPGSMHQVSGDGYWRSVISRTVGKKRVLDRVIP
ncbi:hypothetical protein ASZ90_016180 [hydrocarbon metagenome]|uniref:Uncharacterized protein n=1 Tax=hydrocarbon metagenome TaxID=938273 RepID=A0A0W8F1A4_9ZZZZ